MTEGGHQEQATERLTEEEAQAYKDALLHFIETHDDLKEVGRATDILRKLDRGQRELNEWELELARHARVEVEAE
ncbi:MAG TPA: hypothetical protein VF994_14495 [Myxococcales bacterium]